jgi:hypothetical protein
MRTSFGVFLGAALALVGAAACQSAVNLDVSYTQPADGGAGSSPDGAAIDAGLGGASSPATTPTVGNELEACPCDQTQGLSCCVSSAGPAFCTTDRSRCDGENGGFYGCFGPTTDSLCCWHGSGAHSITAYAGKCDDGPEACTSSADCSGGKDCLLTECAHVRVGACGQVPTCPPGTAPN